MFFCDLTKKWSSESDSQRDEETHNICLSRSTRLPFFFRLFFSGYSQGYFLNSIQREVCSVRYVPKHTAGMTGTRHSGKFGTTLIPVPDTSVNSARHQYRYRTHRYALYDTNTGTRHFGKFMTTSIPVAYTSVKSRYDVDKDTTGTCTDLIPADTSVISVKHQYRYRTVRLVWYDIHTGAQNADTVANTTLVDSAGTWISLLYGARCSTDMGNYITFFWYNDIFLLDHLLRVNLLCITGAIIWEHPYTPFASWLLVSFPFVILLVCAEILNGISFNKTKSAGLEISNTPDAHLLALLIQFSPQNRDCNLGRHLLFWTRFCFENRITCGSESYHILNITKPPLF